MDFLNEAWFWSAFFVALATLGTLLIQEWLRPRNQARIERLKMYDSEILAAHKSLYLFVSTMEMRFTPHGETRTDFIDLMESGFYKSVKPQMLLFAPEIREILRNFDAQYHCLGDPDLMPNIPFDKFVDNELYKKLYELESLVEKSVDSALNQLR